MSEVNNSGWYALVKYKCDNTTEILPIHKIKVKVGKNERIGFNPKSLTDFDKIKFYTVNTAHGSEDKKEHKWYALIGLLAESREALEHAMIVKRVSWPIILHDESEPNSTDNDAVLKRANSCNVTISSCRDMNRNKKKIKKDATDAVHAQLLASKSLNPGNTCNALESITDYGNIVVHLVRENEDLKSALKAEREQNNPSEQMNNYINISQECLQRIEEKIKSMQDNFQEKLDNVEKVNLNKFAELRKQIANIEDSISMFPLYLQCAILVEQVCLKMEMLKTNGIYN